MSCTTLMSFFYAIALFQAGTAVWLPDIHLLRRQSGVPSSIPPQCSGSCNPALSALQACNPPTVGCLCPPSLQSGLFDCFSCAGMAGQATDYTVPQWDIDNITVACDQAGAPLPVRTFPGQNPNRILATSATVQTQAPSTSAAQTHLPTSSISTSLAASSSGVPSTGTIHSTSGTVFSTATARNSVTIIASTSNPGTISSTGTRASATASSSGAFKATWPICTTVMGLFLEAIFFII